MLSNIRRLSAEALEHQERLSREQFKVYQHQINPHFINNTLQSVKALALTGDTAAISKITTHLGKLLSYSVYNPLDMVELHSELDYIESYILLQRVRYPDITCTMDCPSELAGVRVPKLIIQPIVENAIEHGFAAAKSGRVQIFAQDEGDEVNIIIVDNGAGFEPEALKSVQAMLSDQDGRNDHEDDKHIGIINVHRRLVNVFGEGCGVTILSKPGMQTSVILTVKRKEAAPC
jgi:two-component system sensor histidine kinase YesM